MTNAPIDMIRPCARHVCSAALSTLLLVAGAHGASAQRIDNQIAVFAALDKVTATIRTLEVPLGKTEVYGSLRVTPRVCYTRAPTDQPKTSTFVEVDEVGLDGKHARIFSGWMFAESPGLNAVEHPVFDVWLTGCKGSGSVAAAKAAQPGEESSEGAMREPERRRRVRR